MAKKEEKKLTDIEKLKWEHHQSHRSYLLGQYHKQEDSLFKILILICSGVFSLSLTATKFESVEYSHLLVSSWVLSALALFFMILGLIFSIKSYKKEVTCLDETKKDCIDNIFNSLIPCTTIFAIMLLFLSIIFLIIFYSLNL